ncbi:MAG: site-specific tyrosine recombinase/integron integrase [Dialister sp.]|uniref:site-specific tyrosine recombinase/integron integrase n=1 Tax=Dialister sp. TaxID=1955814 RepID=UPI002E7A7380|nr:site-specific tyrosine recombinase/integron integrase [Dialister sp.]MEE0291008.1 site-specific tyrosine recombinase/integron integrase [Dialister sp.]
MKEELIETIMQQMLPYLDNAQVEKLKDTLHYCMHDVEIVTDSSKLPKPVETNEGLLSKFLAAKRVEGCSVKTLNYYQSVLLKLFSMVPVSVLHMKTEHIRSYLSAYADRTKCSKSNLDNIRRILSSFFTWLEEESYILKNPVRRIHKIKVDKTVKETYSDESMERMRDECHCLRDLAIIDLLASSGMRVGELVRLNREDIDFDNRECIVFGKGSKERPVYFDARTKIHLKNYLDSRTDDNPALFVFLLKPYNRLQISGVEIRLRSLGRELGIPKVHPHKFRRTLATRAIDKGMPIEQVQRLLGHTQIDTTMQYAMINQKNVKVSHQKYIA